MTITTKLFTSCALVVLIGCAEAPPPAPAIDLAAEETKIRAEEAQWAKDWAEKDVAKVVAHYADDAILMAPSAPAMKGKTAIQDLLKSILSDPNVKMEFAMQHVDFSKAADMAVTQGTYTMTMSDAKTKKPVTEKGNYVTAYKKQADGGWKAIQDINTTDGTH